MKMIYRGEQVEVLEQSGSLSKIRDSHDNEFSVKTDKLKPVPAIRLGGRRADYLAAVKDGLTRFETGDTFLRDEPNALVQEGFAITKCAEKVQEGSCN